MFRMFLKYYSKMPTFAHNGDACMDLYSPRAALLYPGFPQTIETGVHIDFSEYKTCMGLILPRSSMFQNGIITMGVIDSGYMGEICVTLINTSDKRYSIYAGDRIAQIAFVNIIPPENLLESIKIIDDITKFKRTTERGENGFGSSGK